jgi:pilus assembly protein Flp/PilA
MFETDFITQKNLDFIGTSRTPSENIMKTFLHTIVRFLKTEEGPTAVEYAMLLLLIFLACLSAIVLLGQSTNRSIDSSGAEIQSAMNAGN